MQLEAILAIAVFSVYFAIMLIIGRISMTKWEFLEWAVVGRKLGWFMFAFAFMATYYSAWATLGVSGYAYKHGLAALGTITGHLVPSAALAWVLASSVNILGRKYGYASIGDLLYGFYRSKILNVLVVISFIALAINFVAVQVRGVGYVFTSLTGMPFVHMALVGMIVLMIYVMLGGMKSAAYTDTLQGILLFFAMFGAGLVAVLFWGNPFVGLFEKFGAKALTFPGLAGAIDPLFALSFMLVIGPWYIAEPHFVQWYLSLKSAREARYSLTLFSLLNPLAYLFGTLLVGWVGLMVLPGINPDVVYMELMKKTLGIVVTSILTAGVIAAAQSTADAVLAGLSAILARDIYVGIVNPKASPRRTLLIARILVALVVVGAFLVALYAPYMLLLLGAVGFAFGGIPLIPLVGCLLWPRATREGAISSVAVALVTIAATTFIWRNPFKIHAGVWGVALGFLTFIVVSYLTKPMPKEIIDKYHGVLARAFKKEPNRLWLPKTVTGWALLIIMVAELLALSSGALVVPPVLIGGIAALYLWWIAWWAIAFITLVVAMKRVWHVDEEVVFKS